MKICIVLGTGNSGAGAVHDYLMSREDFFSPFKGKEFRIVNDPDGIDNLYLNLYRNFSINGAANSIDNFLRFINNTYNSNYNKKNKIYNSDFLKFAEEFTKNIIQISYNGSPQFYFDKITFLKKINFYFNRFILNKNAKNISMLNMVLPCKEKRFIYFANEFLIKLMSSCKNFSSKKNIVIEQGGNIFDPINSTKYYGENRKIIIVYRDPKAIFWSMKRRNSLSYPGNNIKKFVKWYKYIKEKIPKKNYSQNVIKINFENFFKNFEYEKKKLSLKLDIDINCKDNFNLQHTLKNIFKYKDHLTNKEINYLNKNLNDK